MKLSTVFTKARNRLAKHQQDRPYICHVVRYDLPDVPQEDIDRACLVLFERIMKRKPKRYDYQFDIRFGCIALERWLELQGIEVPYRNSIQQMYMYRRRWLNSLIAEFKAKGD